MKNQQQKDDYKQELINKLNSATTLAELESILREHYDHLQNELEDRNQEVKQQIQDYFDGKIPAEELPEKFGLREHARRLKEKDSE